MKKDKTLLPYLQFPTLTHFCYARFSEIFNHVYVSAKDAKFSPNLPLLKDDFDSFSPMGALASILSNPNFKDQYIFINPADMPFTSENTIRNLYANLENTKICVAKNRAFTHNLCGFYHSSIAPLARKFYELDIHKISELFKKVEFKSIEFDEEFYNINYPKDYDNL
ncbi:MAG: molybdenum cofactor guanylyltransferase [Campylobacter sp.]|nr:molybdenum cofactor guanylyltransferase [Campylobacter sp.]